MDIGAVNAKLDIALARFTECEHADMMEAFFDDGENLEEEDDDEIKATGESGLAAADHQAEDYTGHGGTPPPDHSPMGDPEEGGSGGVDNYSYEQEELLSYVAELVDDCAGTLRLDHDVVMNGLEALAGEMADAGEIPPIPDLESASSEAISAWPLAAKMAGIAGRLTEYMKASA